MKAKTSSALPSLVLAGFVFAAGAGAASLPPDDPVGRLIEETASRAEQSHREFARCMTDPRKRRECLSGLRRRLLRALGLYPAPLRTPLNVRRLGATDRGSYTVEKLVFESRPGFLVTANVYVPKGSGPPKRAAVLCPCGHWANAKAQAQVQARCIGLAKLGFVVLTYDPFGQGERRVEGNGHHEYFKSVLVGRNNMTYMIWDSIRALDYLAGRPDVDPSRIGATGASGGGLNTFYLAAVDERVRVACPVVFVSRLREFLETRIRHCPCSHVNGLASFADEGTVLGLTAPRPVLLLTASDDPMFTPAGARNAVRQALEHPFDGVVLDRVPETLLSVFKKGLEADSGVWRLLEAADLPQLRRMSGVPLVTLDLENDARESTARIRRFFKRLRRH